MAKARSKTIERPQANAELDDSSDHPALTPLMRRLAREQRRGGLVITLAIGATGGFSPLSP